MAENEKDDKQRQDGRYDVFISYSHADAKLYGDKLFEEIRKKIESLQVEHGDKTVHPVVFLDVSALKSGIEWHPMIMDALNNCRVFVCMLSDNYFNSQYCMREWLGWERMEIRNGRFHLDTQPVYFATLKQNSLFTDDRKSVKVLSGIEMNKEPWFDKGKEKTEEDDIIALIEKLKKDVYVKLRDSSVVKESFNSVEPLPTLNFVGRSRELMKLHDICNEAHYPIIEGAPGVGKSELAAVYAYGYAHEYPQGRFLIHMEGKRTWEDAVVSLVFDLKSGRRVQRELGIKREELLLSKKELHAIIIDRLLTRAETGRLLLVLDNVEDASIFTEENLESFSSYIPNDIHMIATTRHQLRYTEDKSGNKRTRAEAFLLGNLDHDASFELFCESCGRYFPCLNKPILNKDSDPEYKAIIEIIQLLDGHVWSMELIAGRIAAYYNGRVVEDEEEPVFPMMLAQLKKNFKITGKGIRNTARDSVELLKPSISILAERESEQPIVQLSFFAALLPPDGKKRDVLELCWKMYFSKVSFENEFCKPFDYAYNRLHSYFILQNAENSDKMHRLTREALRQIMREENVFDRTVQMLADLLAEKKNFLSLERWLEILSVTPQIADYYQRSPEHSRFFFRMLSPDSWTTLFENWINLQDCDRPPVDDLNKLCLYWDDMKEKLNGNQWGRLLIAGYDVEEQCPWEKLKEDDWCIIIDLFQSISSEKLAAIPWDSFEGAQWAHILKKDAAQFERFCNWDNFSGRDWADFLGILPGYADKCDWEKLSPMDWSNLLRMQPEFAKRGKWNKANMDGITWCNLLCSQPDFAKECDWDKLDPMDWMTLLQKQPDFGKNEHCPWEKMREEIGSYPWTLLVSLHPQFADQCPWNSVVGKESNFPFAASEILEKQPHLEERVLKEKGELTGTDIADILCAMPDSELGKKSDWSELDGGDWSWLLSRQPRFAPKCREYAHKLSGSDWGVILSRQPQLAEMFDIPWQKLNSRAWRMLLEEQPQFNDKCDLSKLDGEELAHLLATQPQLADSCPFDTLSGFDWANLLSDQPSFANRCKWDKLNGRDWSLVLKKNPQFADQYDVPWGILSDEDWAFLLNVQPQFVEHYEGSWDQLSGRELCILLRKHPQFADQHDVPWDKLSGKDWSNLLEIQPRFASKCPWDKLSGDDWANLLEDQPQFASECPWDKLSGEDWANILEDQPQIAELIPWEMIHDLDWGRLLLRQPQFAKKCPWDMLSGEDWAKLLSGRPQFADNCQWRELTRNDWAVLLAAQPQFAKKCPWDKLSAGNWAAILCEQPEFARRPECPWAKMSAGNWAKILSRQPDFARRAECPWDKLAGKDWARLLVAQPRFAKKCRWDKLSGKDWASLLRKQPQFADKRSSASDEA